uniref:Ferric chelate reductase 1 n=2 Tax=Scleropages formosus TaxID=113540 RepID=A0A8C9RIP8_SCLFO
MRRSIIVFQMPVIAEIIFVLIVALSLKTASSYSNGKVTNACMKMVPDHGYHSSTEVPPYTITVDKRTFSPGEQIRVNLSVTGGKPFKGFLIEARDTGNLNGDAVGSFALVDSTSSQLLKCGQTQGSAVSHTSDAKKTKMQVIWKAPKMSPLSVQFLATVVQRYSVYWVKIPGPVVSQNGVTPDPPHPISMITTMSTVAIPPDPLPNMFSSEGCGSQKTCLRDPVGCDPGVDHLCFFLSFTWMGETVLFELSGPAEGYVSFGLSKDKWMGNDDVYLCVRVGDRVDISAAYLRGRTHPEQVSQSSLADLVWSSANGVIRCRFRRSVHVPEDQRRFNLNGSYYLFVAHGRADDGKIHRHALQPLISNNPIVITGTPEDLSGSRSSVIMKFHGVFMLIAWMTTASTGVIFARYFRHDWPGSALFGQTIWFQVHRTLMVLTVLLTCLGSIFAFTYRGGWSRRAGAHPYLGCAVMALAILQPVMAVFRPPPDSARRWMFNWMHLSAGTIVQIIAVVAIFLGIHQQALLLPQPGSTSVLAVFVVWGVAVELVLEFHAKGLFKIWKNKSADQEAILSSQSGTSSKESRFKKIILGIFLCGNIAFLTVLLHIISNV